MDQHLLMILIINSIFKMAYVKKDKIEHYYINGVHLKNKNHFYLEKIKKKSNFKL
jgi:hypothetical protein